MTNFWSLIRHWEKNRTMKHLTEYLSFSFSWLSLSQTPLQPHSQSHLPQIIPVYPVRWQVVQDVWVICLMSPFCLSFSWWVYFCCFLLLQAFLPLVFSVPTLAQVILSCNSSGVSLPHCFIRNVRNSPNTKRLLKGSYQPLAITDCIQIIMISLSW